MSWATPRAERGLSLREQIEDSLTAAITAGEIQPNELLTVPVLAQRYEVSATPVREAVLNLARRGFVVPVRNKGFRVREVDLEELAQIVWTRRLLESPTMVQVAEVFDSSVRPRFDELAATIRDSAERRDFARYVRADEEFHLGLLGLLENPVLVEIVGGLRDRTRTVAIASSITGEQLEATIAEHVELLDLLEAGDGAAAADLMDRHIGHVLGWWSGVDEGEPAPAAD